ncbi:hypothetical protein BD779DRAFT_465444 [Infundibulicybe gibba]|nr:hypothetical protein BD779DRAFT_465444 [Infundibulicybe gibba]
MLLVWISSLGLGNSDSESTGVYLIRHSAICQARTLPSTNLPPVLDGDGKIVGEPPAGHCITSIRRENSAGHTGTLNIDICRHQTHNVILECHEHKPKINILTL